MVIDDVKDYRDADCMRAINKSTQIIWRTIKARRRKKIDSVVAPSEFPGKIGERHQLDDRYSKVRELLQMFHGCAVCAVVRECPDVHFVNYLAFDADSVPAGVVPSKFARINYLREFVRPFRLKTRCGIGERAFAIHP